MTSLGRANRGLSSILTKFFAHCCSRISDLINCALKLLASDVEMLGPIFHFVIFAHIDFAAVGLTAIGLVVTASASGTCAGLGVRFGACQPGAGCAGSCSCQHATIQQRVGFKCGESATL
jgi:hypothetical protein